MSAEVIALLVVLSILVASIAIVALAYRREIRNRRRALIHSVVLTELREELYEISLDHFYTSVHDHLYLSAYFPKGSVTFWYGYAIEDLVNEIQNRLATRTISIDAALLSKNDFLIKLTEEFLTATRGSFYLQYCKQYTQTYNVQWIGHENKNGRVWYSEVMYGDDLRYSGVWTKLSERRSNEDCWISISKLYQMADRVDWDIEKINFQCHARDVFGDKAIIDSVKKEVKTIRNYVSWIAKHSNDDGRGSGEVELSIDCYSDIVHTAISSETAHYRALLIFISAIRQMKEGSFGKGNSIEKMLVSDSRISRELAKIAFQTEL